MTVTTRPNLGIITAENPGTIQMSEDAS